jgi:hypothetical protein
MASCIVLNLLKNINSILLYFIYIYLKKSYEEDEEDEDEEIKSFAYKKWSPFLILSFF